MTPEDKNPAARPTGTPARSGRESPWGRIAALFSPRKPAVGAQESHIDNNKLAEQNTNLATMRTLMAADRTLMAWVRTALSMISFGFTIYKILQGLEYSGVGYKAVNASPESAGLFLIGLGTISMSMGTVEYWFTIKELRTMMHFRLLRPTFVTALIISVAGLGIFISIIANVI